MLTICKFSSKFSFNYYYYIWKLLRKEYWSGINIIMYFGGVPVYNSWLINSLPKKGHGNSTSSSWEPAHSRGDFVHVLEEWLLKELDTKTLLAFPTESAIMPTDWSLHEYPRVQSSRKWWPLPHASPCRSLQLCLLSCCFWETSKWFLWVLWTDEAN